MTIQFRSLLSIAAFALAMPAIQAQNVDLFGGYSVNRMKPENSSRATMSGWNTSITAHTFGRLGLTADFAGAYGGIVPTAVDSTGASLTLASRNVRQYSFLAGPQLRLFNKGRIETSFKALFGAAHGYVSDVATLPAGTQHHSLNDTAFASLFGTNFDLNVSRRLAFRFSPGMYVTRFGGETQKNFRFSVGPVFRFGER